MTAPRTAHGYAITCSYGLGASNVWGSGPLFVACCNATRRDRDVSSSSTAVGAPAPVAAASASLRHPLTLSLLALTFSTGLIDAASYLGLGRVFTANMTGNVVLLGFGIAGAAGLPVVSPFVSLAAFLLGAVTGGRLAARVAGCHYVHLRTALLIEFTVMRPPRLLPL
jgi:Protein of unknown function (DUF1275)